MLLRNVIYHRSLHYDANRLKRVSNVAPKCWQNRFYALPTLMLGHHCNFQQNFTLCLKSLPMTTRHFSIPFQLSCIADVKGRKLCV
jgi:hypothetical protein